MNTKLSVAGVIANNQEQLKKLIQTAVAVENTFKGKGRRSREKRSVSPAPSKKTAKTRKQKSKQRREDAEQRSHSRERSIKRKESKSCLKGFLAQDGLEAQSGLVGSLTGLGDIPDSLKGLMGAVGELGDEASTFNETMERLTDLVARYDPKDLAGIKDGINDTNDTIKSDFVPVMEKLVNLLNIFEERTRPSNLKEKIAEYLPSKDTVNGILTAALVLSTIYAIHTRNLALQAVITGISVFRVLTTGHGAMHAVFAATHVALKGYQEYMREQPDEKEIVAQGSLEKPLYAAGTIALVATLLGVSWRKATDIADAASKFGDKIKGFEAAQKGWRAFVDACLKGLERAINFIKTVFGGDPVKLRSDPYFFLEQYVAKVHSLRDQFYSGLRDQAVLHQCNELYAEAEKVINELKTTGGTDLQIRDVVECKRVLNNMMTHLGSMNVYSSGQRTAPVTVLMAGAPGVGKTTLMNWAWPVVAARILPKEKLDDFSKNRGNFMYSYNQKDQYYSGYKGQQHMLIDEFGFIRDSATGESVFSELIMLNNNNPYCLNMAALEDKGRYHFRSEMLWLTTNRESFRHDQMPSIQEPQAVLRRLAFAWCVCVKPEWATPETKDDLPQNRLLNKAKLKEHLMKRKRGEPLFPHLVLHKMSSVEWGRIEPKEHSVDEFIDIVVQQYHDNKKEGVDMLNMVQESVDDIIAKRLNLRTEDDALIDALDEDIQDAISTFSHDERSRTPTNQRVRNMADSAVLLEQQSLETDTTGNTKIKDCACASCHSAPIRCTFDSFCKGLAIKHKFDGTTLTVLERGCAYPKVTRSEFDKLYVEQVMSHHANSFANVPSQGHFDDVCFSFEVKRNPHEAIKIFVDYMLSVRLKIGVFDFSNKNYLAFAIVRAAVVVGQVGFIILAVKLIRMVIEAIRGLFSSSSNSVVKAPTHDPESTYPLRKPIIRARRANKELGTRGVEDVIKSAVRSNCFRVDCVVPSTGATSTGVITMVQSQIALLPKHIMESWAAAFEADRDSYLVLKQVFTSNGDVMKDNVAGQNVYLRTVMAFEDGECIIDYRQVGGGEDDTVIVYLEPVRRGKNLVKHFLSKTYHIPNGSHSYFCGIDKNEFTMVEKTGLCSYAGAVRYSQTGTSHSILSSFTTERGDCGTLVGVISTPAPHAIYGIHVAGCPKGQPTAYAARVAREDLIAAIEDMGKRVHLKVDDVEVCLPPATAEIVTQSGHKGPAGTEPLFHVLSTPRPMKTRLTKSPLFGRIGFECTQEPANLRMYNGVDALEHASMKYNKYVRGIPLTRLEQAKKVVGKKLIGLYPPKFCRVLTVQEAIQGVPGERFLCGMPRSSSPGLPWTSMWKGKGKTPALGTSEEIDMNAPELKRVLFEVDWVLESIRGGQRPVIVFTSFLKDELRPIGKAARLISCAPFHYSILMRQYFLGFSEHVMTNRIINGIAVGISPTSDEWTVLGNKHAKKFCVAGDVGNFDCSLEPNIMRQVKDLIHDFYNDYGTPDYHIREALFDELMYSRHAFGNAVYEWIGCNPSGNNLTAILNSIANLLMAYSAVMEIHNAVTDFATDNPFSEVETPEKEVEADSYGDDILLSSDNPAFSFLNFKKVFAKWDIKFTDENKGDEFVDIWTTIHEVTFLKRRFLRLKQYSSYKFVAALSLDTILNCVQWMNKTDHTQDDFVNRVNTMLVELSAHGPDTYYYWQRAIWFAAEHTWVTRRVQIMKWEERFELFLSSDASY